MLPWSEQNFNLEKEQEKMWSDHLKKNFEARQEFGIYPEKDLQVSEIFEDICVIWVMIWNNKILSFVWLYQLNIDTGVLTFNVTWAPRHREETSGCLFKIKLLNVQDKNA